jgi:hypothetical protein
MSKGSNELFTKRTAAGRCRNHEDRPLAPGSRCHCAECVMTARTRNREAYQARHAGDLKTHTCRRCGAPGHNARTCPEPAPAE